MRVFTMILYSYERTQILPLKMWMSILTVIHDDDDEHWKADCKYDKKKLLLKFEHLETDRT